MIRNFITAVQFLTIFTLNRNHREDESTLAQSMIYFPFIGFLIGFILVYADKALVLVALPQTVSNVLLVALSVLITRSLHVDGLADTLDGLMGGRDRESRLAIMKDSRLGTAGAVGIFFVLFSKYVCLNNLFESEKVAALLTAPMLSRWSQTLMVFNANYGRREGLGKHFVGHLRASGALAAAVIAVVLSGFVVFRLDVQSLLLTACIFLGVLLLTLLGKFYLVRKLGGITGDAIGAVSELNEVFVLLMFVIFSTGN